MLTKNERNVFFVDIFFLKPFQTYKKKQYKWLFSIISHTILQKANENKISTARRQTLENQNYSSFFSHKKSKIQKSVNEKTLLLLTLIEDDERFNERKRSQTNIVFCNSHANWEFFSYFQYFN